MSGEIFISHASADDEFVKRLREALDCEICRSGSTPGC